VLESALTLGDATDSFATFMVDGTELDTATIADHLDRSVMLVTALAPVIGYDRAAGIALRATAEGITLREAALADGVAPDVFDAAVDPLAMTRSHPLPAADTPPDA
jgi:fumarate hydratase, class II